jgi:hypothetical protein
MVGDNAHYALLVYFVTLREDKTWSLKTDCAVRYPDFATCCLSINGSPNHQILSEWLFR